MNSFMILACVAACIAVAFCVPTGPHQEDTDWTFVETSFAVLKNDTSKFFRNIRDAAQDLDPMIRDEIFRDEHMASDQAMYLYRAIDAHINNQTLTKNNTALFEAQLIGTLDALQSNLGGELIQIPGTYANLIVYLIVNARSHISNLVNLVNMPLPDVIVH